LPSRTFGGPQFDYGEDPCHPQRIVRSREA
jgi:hypothetical protein